MKIKKIRKIFTTKLIVKKIRKPDDFHEILRKQENSRKNPGEFPGKPGFSMFLCVLG